MKKTVIASAANGKYHEVRPNNLPESLGQAWADNITDQLRELLRLVPVIEGIQADTTGVIHLDLTECTPERRLSAYDVVLVALIQLQLHSGGDYELRQLGPGADRSN